VADFFFAGFCSGTVSSMMIFLGAVPVVVVELVVGAEAATVRDDAVGDAGAEYDDA